MDRTRTFPGRTRSRVGALAGAGIALLLLASGCHLDALFSDPPSDADRGPAAPGALEFATQPSGALVDEPITPPPEIIVRDSAGSPDTTFNGAVELSLDSDGAGARLEG